MPTENDRQSQPQIVGHEADAAAEKEEATPHREEEYRVVWEIDLTAPSPREAAEAAQAIQLRPNHATVFMVNGESIDLDEIEAEEED